MPNLTSLWHQPAITPTGYRIIKGACGAAHDPLPDVFKTGGSPIVLEVREDRQERVRKYLENISPEHAVTIKHLIRDLGGNKATMGIDLRALERMGEISSHMTRHNRKTFFKTHKPEH